ncbi:MAG: secretion/conjugation apparatus DotM-related subunit [Thermoplasmataceae archaeon]
MSNPADESRLEDWLVFSALGALVMLAVSWVFHNQILYAARVFALESLYPLALRWPYARGAYLWLYHHRAVSVWEVLTVNGMVFRWIAVPVLLAVAAWKVWRDPFWRWRQPVTLKQLIFRLAQHYPSMQPAARALRAGRLGFTPANQGPWRAPLSPVEFSREAGALPWKDDVMSRQVLTEALTKQIGRPLGQDASWSKLLFHERALMAVFTMFVSGQVDRANSLLDEMSRQFRETGCDDWRVRYLKLKSKFSGAYWIGGNWLAEIDKPLKSKPARKLLTEALGKHAYSVPMLMSCLITARRYGLLPPQQFRWLMLVDRPLWYALHQMPPLLPGEKVRSKRVFVECAGAHAHHRAEVLAGRRLDRPVVGPALEGLMEALKTDARGDFLNPETPSVSPSGESGEAPQDPRDGRAAGAKAGFTKKPYKSGRED